MNKIKFNKRMVANLLCEDDENKITDDVVKEFNDIVKMGYDPFSVWLKSDKDIYNHNFNVVKEFKELVVCEAIGL